MTSSIPCNVSASPLCFSPFIAGLQQLQRRARRRQDLAFAPGTRANHFSHLRLFLLFTAFYGLQDFPAAVGTLILFVEFLTLSYSSVKAVSNALASVKFFHERQGCDIAPFSHLRVRLALRSLPFTMRVHVSQAPPFPPQLLAPLVRAAGSFGPWAGPFRALVILAFFSFARLSSLVPPSAQRFDASRWPTLGDVEGLCGTASLLLKYSKTRQSADGGFRVPFRSSLDLPCPVALILELREAAARLRVPLSTPLFAPFQMRGGGNSLSLSSARARLLLRQGLQEVGLPAGSFTFHSFRRGGCTLAFARGATESDLALHGDWRSDAVRHYYPSALARGRVAAALASNPSPP